MSNVEEIFFFEAFKVKPMAYSPYILTGHLIKAMHLWLCRYCILLTEVQYVSDSNQCEVIF